MSINANMIVDVSAKAVRAGSSSLEFNGLLLTESTKALPFERYESAEAVHAVFGVDSPEGKYATAYWSADVMKTRAPSALIIARDFKNATNGWIRSGKVKDLKELQQITVGSFTIDVDGESKSVTRLNLGSASSYDQIASIVASAITGVTGKFDAVEQCFYFTSLTTGNDSFVSFGVGSDAEKLGLTEKNGAVTNRGSVNKTPAEMMENIANNNRNWVTFANVSEQEISRAVEFAKWASKDLGYIYLPFTTNESAITKGSASDLASMLIKAGVSYTAPIYGDMEYSAFFAGMIASTEWSATNGVKNYAFKQSSYLPALVSSKPIAETLKAKKYNFIGNFATRNADFQISVWGTILGKTFHYIDEVAGMIWLANEVQRALMDGLTTVNRVAYNPSGYNMIRLWMTTPIEAGVNNGYIQSGVTLSNVQKTQLIEAVGADVSREVETKGYYLVIKAPTAEARSNRETPIVQLYFTYGGAVLKIDPSVTAYL